MDQKYSEGAAIEEQAEPEPERVENEENEVLVQALHKRRQANLKKELGGRLKGITIKKYRLFTSVE
jgi:hypothetical protein